MSVHFSFADALDRTIRFLSSRSVEILSTERERAEGALVAMQVTTRSPLGALALETGGLLIDACSAVAVREWTVISRDGTVGSRPIIERSEGILIVLRWRWRRGCPYPKVRPP